MFGKKNLLDQLRKKAVNINKKSRKTIVFAEIDDTILQACHIIAKKWIAKPLIVGNKADIKEALARLKIKNIVDNNIIDHLAESNKEQLQTYTNKYIEMRKNDGKIITSEQALETLSKPHFYAAMLLSSDLADGMICGIHSETKPYIPAFEIIKTRAGISRASGLFIMSSPGGNNTFFFADCALNIDPTPEILADIALTTADSAISFGVKPKIAMLSFSTRDSAKHALVDKVKKATSIVREKNSGLMIDGEIQLDAAIVPQVYKKKCKDSVLEGNANILIFPDLNSGNIGYKLVERLGKYKAIGPIMQGLNKPVNDLSRGCSVDDVVDLTAITVVQGM